MVLDILRLRNEHRVIGLLDTYKPYGWTVDGQQVIGTRNDLPALVAAGTVGGVIVAVGDNWTRARIVREVRALVPDIEFVTAVHPAAVVAEGVTIGPGTVVMAGAVVNPGCEVGEFCIVNTRASLDHESVLGNYASLGPGVTTGGRVRIGAWSAVGIGATVLQEIEIGTHTVVGAGSTVLHNVPDSVVAYGTPARVVRGREPGDRYLGDQSAQAARA